MKCAACNYERVYDIEIDQNVGDEEFVHINLTATIDEEWGGGKIVELYACPKCNTVQMNEW